MNVTSAMRHARDEQHATPTSATPDDIHQQMEARIDARAVMVMRWPRDRIYSAFSDALHHEGMEATDVAALSRHMAAVANERCTNSDQLREYHISAAPSVGTRVHEHNEPANTPRSAPRTSIGRANVKPRLEGVAAPSHSWRRGGDEPIRPTPHDYPHPRHGARRAGVDVDTSTTSFQEGERCDADKLCDCKGQSHRALQHRAGEEVRCRHIAHFDAFANATGMKGCVVKVLNGYGCSESIQPNEAMLAHAIERLRRFRFVGLFEDWERMVYSFHITMFDGNKIRQQSRKEVMARCPAESCDQFTAMMKLMEQTGHAPIPMDFVHVRDSRERPAHAGPSIHEPAFKSLMYRKSQQYLNYDDPWDSRLYLEARRLYLGRLEAQGLLPAAKAAS